MALNQKLPAVEPVFVVGTGLQVLADIARLTGLDGVQVLKQIVAGLLARKGVDWTAPILAEYLGLFDCSLGTFVLVWDKLSRKLISHGAVFQSVQFPAVGLVAHIRTEERFTGLGLGTRVTRRVVQAGFANGAKIIVLATDDKLLRLQAGEKAATGLYSKIGFTVIAEKKLADTVDWLMAISREVLSANTPPEGEQGGQLPPAPTEAVARLQTQLVVSTREGFVQRPSQPRFQPVTNGDLAALFLLFNIGPGADFELKLSAWNIQVGPELEREFVVSVRPALEDRDRLEDASRVLRNDQGLIVAVCGAKQESPFTRQTYRLDFYCLPEFLRTNADLMRQLVIQTIAGLTHYPSLVRPMRLVFWGVDEEKIAVFRDLGFILTPNRSRFNAPQTGSAFDAREFVRNVESP
jgi:hypothetical protein